MELEEGLITINFMAKPRKNKNPGRVSGRFSLLGVEISSALKSALDAYSVETGRSKRWIVEKAVQAYLATEGRWPPKPPGA